MIIFVTFYDIIRLLYFIIYNKRSIIKMLLLLFARENFRKKRLIIKNVVSLWKNNAINITTI